MFNQFSKYEDAFRDWRRDGLPGLKAESYRYIEFLTSPDDDQTAIVQVKSTSPPDSAELQRKPTLD